MKNLKDEWPVFRSFLSLVSEQFGADCEVVLHDLTKDYRHTIVDIRNGHVTEREIGGCGSNLGLEVLNGSERDGNRFNYVTRTADGKTLRSSSMYIKDDAGAVIGAVCINLDITRSLAFEEFLRQYNSYGAEQDEFFAKDVNSLMDYLIQQAQNEVGKNPKEMSKDERLAFLTYLDNKGAFQIAKSSVRVCEALGVSKFTLYSDLEAIRGKQDVKAIKS